MKEALLRMKKVKLKKFKKVRRIGISIIIFLLFIISTRSFNRYIEPQLLAIAKQHTEFAINNIVKEVLSDMNYTPEQLYESHANNAGEIVRIDYNSHTLNKLLHSALNTIDKALIAAQDGKEDPTTKNVFYEDGVLYEIPLGYVTNIFFLYDKGPKVNVRMRMLNDVTGEIKTESKPYGINNTMLEIKLAIKVKAQIITFLSTTEMESICELPLVVQIINGKVPDMIPYTAKP